MTHFNWYIDTVADFYGAIPPKWNLVSNHPARSHFIEDGNWGLISPWDLNKIGILQDGKHRWASYDTPVDNGFPIIPIIFHKHWNPHAIDILIEYLNRPKQQEILKNDKAQLLLHYAVEGFAEEVFQGIAKLQALTNLSSNKILFCSGSLNIQDLYNTWAIQRGLNNNNRIRVCYDLPWLRHVLHSRQLADLKDKNLQLSIKQWEIYKRARYVCLNRRLHPHRLLAVTELIDRNLLQYGKVSLPKVMTESYDIAGETTKDFLQQWRAWNGLFRRHERYDELEILVKNIYNEILPLSADNADLSINLCHDINPELSDIPISIVTETHFFNNLAFASEKIWKPMAYGQIFLPIAAKDYNKGLKQLGFKTFDNHLTELTEIEFDNVQDHLVRMKNIMDITNILCTCSEPRFISFLEQCEEDVYTNKDIIFNYPQSRELSSRSLKKEIEKYVI